MKAEELKNPIDRAYAERSERRHRAKTYRRNETVLPKLEKLLRDSKALTIAGTNNEDGLEELAITG